MESELRSIRFREKPVHFSLIKKRWFLYWYLKEESNGRVTSLYNHYCEKYGPLFYLWREIISGHVITNRDLIKKLLVCGRNNIVGFLEYIRHSRKFDLMNRIIHRLVNSSKVYRPGKFGSYFKYMSDENLRLAKNCWDENQMIIDIADRIFSPKMIETLNKLTNLVGIDLKTIAEVIYDESVNELGLECKFKELQVYMSKFENYIYKV
jgi:hypothetical protein